MQPPRGVATSFLLFGIILLISQFSFSQGGTVTTAPFQKVEVIVPYVLATTTTEADVLAATLATAVRDTTICCGKDSDLHDAVYAADARSLSRVGERLRGKYRHSDGSAFSLADKYWPGYAVRAEDIIASLSAQRPLIIRWDDRLCVLYGAVFDLNKYQDGTEVRVVRKFLLIDTRYAGDKRYVEFDRQKDDFGKMTEFLSLTIEDED